MTPAEMVTLCYEMSHTSAKQIGDGSSATGDTRAYKYLNIAKDRFWSALCTARTGADVSWERWTENIVSGQTEYLLPNVVIDANGIKKIKELGISYDGSTYTTTGKIKYCPARKVDTRNLKHDWYYYEENQSQDSPIYFVSDKSIFIAPYPTSAVTAGIKLEGVQKITDYTDSTTQAGAVIPEEYHYALVQGALPYFYRKQGKIQQASAEMQEYERIERESLIELANIAT
jgi:hypothetical protein